MGVNAGNYNYVASDSVVIWDATANMSYGNDIAGIGRDDAATLNQKQSKSVNNDALVTIGLGAIAASNAAIANTFAADKSFLIWGNDDGATTVATAVSGATNAFHMARIWRAQETGTVGSVLVQIPTSAITLGAGEAAFLVRSTDATFTVTDTFTHLPINGSNYEATVDFASGDYFTFGRGSDIDTDLDGVLDLADIDDDNDGIPRQYGRLRRSGQRRRPRQPGSGQRQRWHSR